MRETSIDRRALRRYGTQHTSPLRENSQSFERTSKWQSVDTKRFRAPVFHAQFRKSLWSHIAASSLAGGASSLTPVPLAGAEQQATDPNIIASRGDAQVLSPSGHKLAIGCTQASSSMTRGPFLRWHTMMAAQPAQPQRRLPSFDRIGSNLLQQHLMLGLVSLQRYML
jgi:hypothetical protein